MKSLKWFRTYLHMAIAVAILGLMFFIGYRHLAATANAPSATAPKKTNAKDLKDWPLLPRPPIPTFGTARPELNPLLVRVKNAGIRGDPMDGHTITSVAMLLVKEHPLPEVRELWKYIESKEVRFIQVERGGKIAGFSLMPRWIIQEAYPDETRDLVPTFSVTPSALREALQNPDGIYLVSTYVYHEFLHYKDWRAAIGTDEESLFVAKDASVKQTPEECTGRWNSEMRAYTGQCELQDHWGLANRSTNCLLFASPEAFKQDFFLDEVRQGEFKECHQIWARLAGHPHPEAFLEPK